MQLVPDGSVYDPEYRRALPPLLEGALRGDAAAAPTTARSSRRDSHGVALPSSTPNEPGAGRRRPSVINALRRTSSPAGGAAAAPPATTPRGGEGSARPSARPSSGNGAPSAAHLVRLAHKSSAQALAVQREAAQGRALPPHGPLTQSAPVLESARSPGFRATAADDRVPAPSPAAPLPLFDAKSLSTTLRRLPSQKRLLQQQLDAAQLAPVGDGGGDDSGWSGRAKVPAQLRAGAVRRGTGRAAQVKQLRAVGSGWHGMPAPKPGAGWFDAQQELTSRHRSHAMAQLATGAEELTLQVRRMGRGADAAGTADGERR